MRMAFGLAGILIMLGVIVWVLNSAILPYNQQVVKENKKAREQVSQLAGKDAQTGANVLESITLDRSEDGGRLVGVLVTDIVAGGAMQRFYGLQRNDIIVKIGPQDVRDQIASFEAARDFLLDAYQRQFSLVVVRRGERMTLPLPQPTAAPNAPPADAQPSGNPLRRQVNQIPGIPTP